MRCPAKDQKAFIREAIQGNLAEIDMGKLAQRASKEGVKTFGRMLVDDHSAADQRARAVAQQLNVSPSTKPSHMVSDHQKDIAAYRAQAQAGAQPTASMAREALPTLEKHLTTAETPPSQGDGTHAITQNTNT